MTMKWNLGACFFSVFFLCFVFLCSLFLALLNAVRCCYLLVILLLLLFKLLHTFSSSSLYSTKVCPLWPLLLRPSLVFLPQLLHWDLAHLAGTGRQRWPRLMCPARPVHIYWFSFYSRFIFLSIPLPGHVQNDHRGEREKGGVTKPSAISAVIGLPPLPLHFLVAVVRCLCSISPLITQKNADKLTNIYMYALFRIGIIFLLFFLFFFFFVDGIEHCLQVSSPFFHKKVYNFLYKSLCMCVLVLCALIISRTNIT